MNLSTGVFDDFGHESTVLYGGPEHLWDGLLFENTFLFSFDWQTDVNCAALCRQYLHSKAILRQINLTRVCRIKLDGRSETGDLEGKRGRSRDGY